PDGVGGGRPLPIAAREGRSRPVVTGGARQGVRSRPGRTSRRHHVRSVGRGRAVTPAAPALPHVHRGKVRDLYDAGAGLLLLVAPARLWAFDVVMAEPIPDKGRVLTATSAFWFEHLAPTPNHLVSTDLADFSPGAEDPGLAGRSMLVRRCDMVPVEC